MKKIIEKIKSLDKGTILRTILMVLATINQIVALIGQTTFAASSWYQWLSFAITLVTMIITYWYNNDWSKLSQVARDVFDMLKDGKITKDEVEKLIKKNKKEEPKDEQDLH